MVLESEIRKLYALNFSFNEFDAKKNHGELYNSIISEYGNWKKGIKKMGIDNRTLKEREKFQLYFIMKNRYKKFGDIALRLKNIDPEIKGRIVESYKTVKNLKSILDGWSEDKVLYELRKEILTGNDIDKIMKKKDALAEKIETYFGNKKNAKEAYNKKFGIIEMKNSAKEVNENEEELVEMKTAAAESAVLVDEIEYIDVENENKTVIKNTETNGERKLINLMIEMGIIQKEHLNVIDEVENTNKTEIIDSVLKLMLEENKKGNKVKEENIKKIDPGLYYSIKYHYKNLEGLLLSLI